VVVGFVLAVLALNALAAGGVLWLQTSVPMIDGRLSGLSGLQEPVELTRDSRGVLYIKAGTATDASFALGFAHAQDRLWQMELTRRIGMGRLAEIVGEPGLNVDRMIRTLGLHRLAEVNLQRLSPEPRAHVDAYAAGVNAYLDSRSGALPLEFIALGFKPEPWRPADSLVWGRLMSLQLAGNWFGEILRVRMLKAGLTLADLDTLWVTDSDKASAPTAPSLAGIDAVNEGHLAGLADAMPSEIAPRLASNAWALSGSHTPTGKPVLAGDPHLALTDPVHWTLARVEAPGYRRVGAFAPGVPFLVIGHNGRIAWSMTTTPSDTQDLFVEKLDPTDPGRYLTADGAVAFETRIETIRVGDTVTEFVLRSTRHGPVVSDAMSSAGAAAPDGAVLALASPVLREDDDTAEALFRMAAAAGASEFIDALRGFHTPQQNVAFADVDGRIGLISAGRVPLRRSGDGFLPSAGWTGEQDWLGWAPFDALPATVDPTSGALVNANNRVTGVDPDLYLGRGFDAPYRAERIIERLRGADGSVAAMSAIQSDTVSLFARNLVPVLLQTIGSIAPDSITTAAVDLLRAWNGDMARDRPEPVIFAAWIDALHQRLFADDLGPLMPQYGRIRAETLLKVLTTDQRWCDDQRTEFVESCTDTVAGALSEAMAAMIRQFGGDVAEWRWGNAHHAVFEHRVWSQVPVLDRLLQRRSETGGGDYTVSRGSWSRADNPAFKHAHGASLRVVYDLSDLDRSGFVAALGPSGNLFSQFYSTWQADWASGRLFEVPERPDTARATLVLTP
jgi:penicillin G amidase